MVGPQIDYFLPDNVTRNKPIIQKTIPEVRGVICATGRLNANIPEDFLVIGNDLKKNRRKPMSTSIRISQIGVVGEAVKLDWTSINGTTHIGERSELFESLGGFVEPATADGYFDEFGVELSGEEAGDHIGNLGDEVGF